MFHLVAPEYLYIQYSAFINVCRVSAVRESREPFEHAVIVVVMICVVAVFSISATKEGVTYFSYSRLKDSGQSENITQPRSQGFSPLRRGRRVITLL